MKICLPRYNADGDVNSRSEICDGNSQMHTEFPAMQDRDWDDFRYFLEVNRRGSVSAAAKFLNVNHSTVLRRLSALERRLGVRLFDRLAAGYALTQAGEELCHELRGVNDQIEAAERHLGGRDLGLAGLIRITTTDTLAGSLLVPSLAAFRALHPAVRFEIVIDNSFLSLSKREADIAVRPVNKPPENLTGRKVGQIRTAVYATKRYLGKSHGKQSWDRHDWIAADDSLAHLAQAKWIKRHIPEERIIARLDSLTAMVDAVRSGMGVGLLLCFLADPDTELIRVAEPIGELDTDVWILTHPAVKQIARVKALADHLFESLRASNSIARRETRAERHPR
jgi:DNA-binding transcriptional LysR family regulator